MRLRPFAQRIGRHRFGEAPDLAFVAVHRRQAPRQGFGFDSFGHHAQPQLMHALVLQPAHRRRVGTEVVDRQLFSVAVLPSSSACDRAGTPTAMSACKVRSW